MQESIAFNVHRSLDSEADAIVEDAVERLLRSTPPGKVQAAREVLEALATGLSSPSGSRPAETRT